LIQFLQKLLGLTQKATPSEKPQSPLENASVPSWKAEVLIHPNYWIELNFTRVEKLAPIFKNIIDAALHNGGIKDINREAAQDTISLLCETLTIQFHSHVGHKEAEWSVNHSNDILLANVRTHEEKPWARAQDAWTATKEIIKYYGISLKDIQESWDRSTLTGQIKVPTRNFQLAVDSPLMWNVLHRSRKFPILWKNSLWIPK
jgi:hypothetical protein